MSNRGNNTYSRYLVEIKRRVKCSEADESQTKGKSIVDARAPALLQRV